MASSTSTNVNIEGIIGRSNGLGVGTVAPSRVSKGKVNEFGAFLPGLVLITLIVIWGLLWFGHPYYLLPIAERSAHPLHQFLKPSGVIGRALGISGTVMMLLSFLYYVRKRSRLLQRIGTQGYWLRLHIYLGLTGPVLVTFHTSGKLSGIAAVAYYSMMAMVLSGILGRYLYSKIPRTRKGGEMSLAEIEVQLGDMIDELKSSDSRDQMLESVSAFLSKVRQHRGGLISTVTLVVADDLSSPFRIFQAWKIASIHPAGFPSKLKTTRLILKQRRLLKKLAVLDASQKLFAYWHIFHKPFTILATVVISAHITIATYFGYGVNW